MQSPFQVQFIGATGTVTGSKYLVKYDRYKVLIDCGLFQGIKNVSLVAIKQTRGQLVPPSV